MGILSGLATGLDPRFNVFASAEPFARKMLSDESASVWGTIWAQAVEQGGALVQLPAQTRRLIDTALRGDLHMHVVGSDELIRELRALNTSLHRLIWTLIFGVLLLAGIVLGISGYAQLVPWVIGAALVALVWIVVAR